MSNDFNLTDADGELWVHLSDPRPLRPALVEFVRSEFEHGGDHFRIVERGLPIGTELFATGCVQSTSVGELTLANDQEVGSRPRGFGRMQFVVLPKEVAARRAREVRIAPIVVAVLFVLSFAAKVIWPGVLTFGSRAPLRWTDAVAMALFGAALAGVPLLFAFRLQHDREVDELVGDLLMSFGLVRSRLLSVRRGLDAIEAVEMDEPPGGAVGEPSPRDSSDPAVSDPAVSDPAVPPFPDAEQVGETRREIEQLDTRWQLLQPRLPAEAGSGDPMLDGLVAQQVDAWRLLGLAVGHYRKAVTEAGAVRDRGGRRAIRLAVRLPELPPSLPSVAER